MSSNQEDSNSRWNWHWDGKWCWDGEHTEGVHPELQKQEGG